MLTDDLTHVDKGRAGSDVVTDREERKRCIRSELAASEFEAFVMHLR